ncbi:transposase [Lacticaseibacillus chiayiensis]|uniref:Transposase n=1 Tax=Lacticaseibacillus chiayiensis TaxID=2100821 RepID=A0A4Q1THB9_9LACO|nr:IS3 family transposase [Lacticaseibacillus chiayiensis]RXT17716.1 transposase [Lacticaseibacillus chiayiensis]
MCAYIGVSRAAYYKWTHRKITARELENDAILTYIIKRQESNNYIYGVRTMTMYINVETPYHVSQGRVRRIMRSHGIYSSIRVAKRDRKAEKKEFILANKLLREDGSHDFTPERPNITWATDCSELRFGVDIKQRLRLSAIKDLYDGSILAWDVAGTETTQLVTATMTKALKANHGLKPEILHSDQGSVYTSRAYNTLLTGNGITHSMSRPGTPGDNSPMESFWSQFKTEELALKHPLSEIELIAIIKKYINWHNKERRQLALNGMTPEEYRNHAVQESA